MKKAVTINISGSIFHIDEDAHAKLKNYLQLIEKYFKEEEGENEIMADIEARIAELLKERLSEHKQVINLEDVDKVIEIMGYPEQFSETEGTQSGQKQQSSGYRRVYRDPDNRIIGGVCSGIGAYWNIDPVIIRILFIIIVLLSFGIGLLLYLILWIVIPEASTIAQKLEMRGEAANISNIGKFFKEEFENVKKNIKFKKKHSTQ